jgi:hypothetical protein
MIAPALSVEGMKYPTVRQDIGIKVGGKSSGKAIFQSIVKERVNEHT